MDGSPMNRVPRDTLHQIFWSLPLKDIMTCRCVCRSLHELLTSSSFLQLISTKPPLRLLALRPPHHHHDCQSSFHVYDPHLNKWLRLTLDFLPFTSPHPVASAGGLIYLWGDSPDSTKSLVVCNPFTRRFHLLPHLGSAWSRHGSVLADSNNRVMVLTELAALFFSSSSGSNHWLKFSSNLPSKPRSPVLISNSVYCLCDVGSPWRSQWKLFACTLNNNNNNHHHNWVCLERQEWGDIFDIIKRPRLVRGEGSKKILMVGGLKSTFSLTHPACSTILILRLDLESLEWEEAGRMPLDMYRCFQDSTKLKVFGGGGDRVCFSTKRLPHLALWDSGLGWRWIHDLPGYGDSVCRGFAFEARLTTWP